MKCHTCGAEREYIGKHRWRCPTYECMGIIDFFSDPPKPDDVNARIEAAAGHVDTQTGKRTPPAELRCEECNAEGGPSGVLLSMFLTEDRWRCYDQSACLRRSMPTRHGAKADCENCLGSGQWHSLVTDEDCQCPCVWGEAMKEARCTNKLHGDGFMLFKKHCLLCSPQPAPLTSPSEEFVSGYNAGRYAKTYDVNEAWATFLKYGGHRGESAWRPGDPTIRHVVAWMRATYPQNKHAQEWADEIDHVFLGRPRPGARPCAGTPPCPECGGTGQTEEDGTGALGYVVKRACPRGCVLKNPYEGPDGIVG